jgi:hypothetical protein
VKGAAITDIFGLRGLGSLRIYSSRTADVNRQGPEAYPKVVNATGDASH